MLRARIEHVFLVRVVQRAHNRVIRPGAIATLALTLACSSCFFHGGYFLYSSQGGGSETAVGEEHDVNLPAREAFILAQDALRGQGVLFTVRPDQSLETMWQDAEEGPGLFGSIVGVRPRYRYEIRAVPLGPRQSRIIVNVRGEDMPAEQLAGYQASRRLDLFAKVDQLARDYPPRATTPAKGGVNFALLPNEDLRALAERVTGDAENWRQIARDNGLSSPTDLGGVQSIWVRNSLLARPESDEEADESPGP